ncbi:MAG: chromosome segregation protein SMC [Clostridia bacterium]|nr:chromosome segregation protein SMC [Clostridia bacterium]
MYLKKLELQGFKSFADKTTLEFKPGITAVIGPNGSGKSNVSDAIRWVLGEQSIKNLRGSKLEDVIFAGTQARKSVSFAEVSITMDNQDGKLPVDYSEVTVTRRVYRSGESEFFINKNQCRLKDIVELFMDTGIGRDGYSIIGQGRIDEILSTKSEERRRIFEDAAGIVKYRTRKEEAEKKLDNTRQNLLRINDIVTELENQLEPLREQSEKAKKYLEIRDQLRYLEVGLFINNINKGKVKLEELTKQVEEVLNQTTYEDNKLNELQTLKEEIRAAIEEMTQNIEGLQAQIFEAQNNIEKQKAEIAVKQTKIEHNTANVEVSKKEIEDYNNKKVELEKEIEDRKARKARLFDDKKRFEDELKEKEEELAKLSENLTNEQKRIEELKAKIMENIDVKFEKMEVLKDLTANSETNNSRIKQIDEEIKDNKYTLDKERMKKEDENVELTKVSKVKEELGAKLEKSLKIKEEYSSKVAEFEDRIRKNLDETNNKESRYKFLVETENEFEGYNRAVKEVMQKCQKDKEFGKNICGTIASLIKVPSEYEVAIEMVLGNTIQNIVTETENDAKNAIEYLKQNNFGRASFFPITAVKGEKLKNNFNEFSGFIGIASDLIDYDKKYEQIIFSLLGRTVIVKDMDEAIKIAKKNKYSFRIVTLDGDILNASGQMTGGSVFKKTTSILSRSREIDELQSVVKKLKEEYSVIVKELEDYKNEAAEALTDIDEVEKQYHEAEIKFATENEKMIAIDNNIDRITKRNSMLEAEKETAINQMNTVKNDIENINNLIRKCETENIEMQAVVDEFSSKNEEQQRTFDDLNSDIMDLKISVSSFDESSNSMDEILERIQNDINNCVGSVDKRNADIKKMLTENEELKVKIEEAEKEIENVQNSISGLEEKLNEHKEERNTKNIKIVEIEKEVENQFRTLDILHDQATKLDVKKSKVEADIEEIQNKMWDDYETTLNTAQNYAEVTSSTAKEVDKLKSEVKSLGNINVNAIEEYKAVGERYEFLRTQKIDLEESAASLEKIISDMIELMKIQFAQKFEVINKNFGEVFVELFGGGRAELRLSDETNILESGIEIEVQPPGKKLQNMMLLSGGERAFTAIALLFAILRLSPSPFCILDEIEAALDDVNVYRYADYLKKFSANTQFLVITHRKGSMEAANTVYGATMQEHGITKLVSMKLDEK